MSVRVFAPAKINLTLKVGRPRADGLHPLESVVAFADVGDWIEAEVQPDSPFHIDGPYHKELMEAPGNIVLDAWEAFVQTMSEDRSAALRLEKNLPIASGIGGGSSDAAATLKALNLVWGLGYDEAKVIEIARRLGSDVPVCVLARPSFMTGTGKDFVEMHVPRLHAVLVNPNQLLPTPSVYRQFDAMKLGGGFEQARQPDWRDADKAIADMAMIGNDLEAPASCLMPLISDTLAELRGDPLVRYAGMSGSGATMFALTQEKNAAETLARRFGRRHQGWWIRPTRLGA